MTNMVEECVGAELSEERISRLLEYYTPSQTKFIVQHLSEAELRVIDDTPGMFEDDYIYVAATNRIIRERPRLAEYLDVFHCKDLQHYNWKQGNWYEEDAHLLAEKNGRQPSDLEVMRDFTAHGNHVRFKIYYCLKHPDKVSRPEGMGTFREPLEKR